MLSFIKLSQFLYFLLIMIFLAFVFVYHKSVDDSIHTNIVLLFSFLLFPLFDALYNMFFKEWSIKRYFWKVSNIYSLLVYIVALLLVWYLGYMSLVLFLFISLCYIIFTWLDGRIFFAAAIIVFCYVAFYLIFSQYPSAENLSIYAYYFLIAGVISQIGEHLISNNNTPNNV